MANIPEITCIEHPEFRMQMTKANQKLILLRKTIFHYANEPNEKIFKIVDGE